MFELSAAAALKSLEKLIRPPLWSSELVDPEYEERRGSGKTKESLRAKYSRGIEFFKVRIEDLEQKFASQRTKLPSQTEQSVSTSIHEDTAGLDSNINQKLASEALLCPM